MRRLLALIVLVGIALGGAAYWWLHQPLDLGPEPLELAIEPGTTPRGVARDVVFDHAQGGFTAEPIWRLLDGEVDATLLYRPVLKFLEV